MPRSRGSAAAGPAPVTVGLAIRPRHYREALALALRPRRLLVTDLGDGPIESLVANLLERQPAIVLVDLSSDTTALIRETHRTVPETRTIALNQSEDEGAAVALFEAGATGYLPHSASVDDVVLAIRDAVSEELRCSPRVTAALARRLADLGDRAVTRRVDPRISAKEAQILPLLELGLTNKEIAQKLGVEQATIKNHVHNILRKLGVHRRTEAVRRYRVDAPAIRIVVRDPEDPASRSEV